MESAATVAVVGAPLDPGVRGGNAAFEKAPEEAIAGSSSRHGLLIDADIFLRFGFGEWNSIEFYEYLLDCTELFIKSVNILFVTCGGNTLVAQK